MQWLEGCEQRAPPSGCCDDEDQGGGGGRSRDGHDQDLERNSWLCRIFLHPPAASHQKGEFNQGLGFVWQMGKRTEGVGAERPPVSDHRILAWRSWEYDLTDSGRGGDIFGVWVPVSWHADCDSEEPETR